MEEKNQAVLACLAFFSRVKKTHATYGTCVLPRRRGMGGGGGSDDPESAHDPLLGVVLN